MLGREVRRLGMEVEREPGMALSSRTAVLLRLERLHRAGDELRLVLAAPSSCAVQAIAWIASQFAVASSTTPRAW